eukprot:jgi/Mesvir1/12076/Mv00356-RA.1
MCGRILVFVSVWTSAEDPGSCTSAPTYLLSPFEDRYISGENAEADYFNVQTCFPSFPARVTWFKLVVEEPSFLAFEVVDADFDAVTHLLISDDGTCNQVACISTGNAIASDEPASGYLMPGRSYFLGVRGYGDEAGSFTVRATNLLTISTPCFPSTPGTAMAMHAGTDTVLHLLALDLPSWRGWSTGVIATNGTSCENAVNVTYAVMSSEASSVMVYGSTMASVIQTLSCASLESEPVTGFVNWYLASVPVSGNYTVALANATEGRDVRVYIYLKTGFGNCSLNLGCLADNSMPGPQGGPLEAPSTVYFAVVTRGLNGEPATADYTLNFTGTS